MKSIYQIYHRFVQVHPDKTTIFLDWMKSLHIAEQESILEISREFDRKHFGMVDFENNIINSNQVFTPQDLPPNLIKSEGIFYARNHTDKRKYLVKGHYDMIQFCIVSPTKNRSIYSKFEVSQHDS